MSGLLLRAGGLLAVYLLVLTSVRPGDIAFGGVLALAVAWWLRPRRAGAGPAAADGPRRAGRVAWAAVATLAETLDEIARGTWRTARFCLGRPAQPGLVEIPREDRSDLAVGLWGMLTGEAPDELPVVVDDERGVLVVHTVDASDPEGVRERHHRNRERRQRRVVH